jgi:regulator of sigma D
MATKRKTEKKEVWPKVNIGTHLSVIDYEDGSHELIWDDDKLLEEVREAIQSVENKSAKRK